MASMVVDALALSGADMELSCPLWLENARRGELPDFNDLVALL